MFSKPSRLGLLRGIFLITAGLSLLAVWNLIGLAHRLGVELSSSINWMGMLAALGILAGLALFGTVASFSKAGERLWPRFAARVWSRNATRWVGIPLFFMALILYSLFTFSSLGGLMNSALWARLLVFWFLTLLGAAGLSMWQDRVTFAGGLMLTALSQAMIHRVAMEFPEITNYPFALGWSETTRFYLASLFVSKDVYGQQLALPIINPSLHILLVPPYWFDAPLWFHRFWQIAVRYILLGLTAWALAKLLPLSKRSDRFIFWLWVYLYLFQGPLYFNWPWRL